MNPDRQGKVQKHAYYNGTTLRDLRLQPEFYNCKKEKNPNLKTAWSRNNHWSINGNRQRKKDVAVKGARLRLVSCSWFVVFVVTKALIGLTQPLQRVRQGAL